MIDNQYSSTSIKSLKITPKQVYLSRRNFIKAAGVIGGASARSACAPKAMPTAQALSTPQDAPISKNTIV